MDAQILSVYYLIEFKIKAYFRIFLKQYMKVIMQS